MADKRLSGDQRRRRLGAPPHQGRRQFYLGEPNLVRSEDAGVQIPSYFRSGEGKGKPLTSRHSALPNEACRGAPLPAQSDPSPAAERKEPTPDPPPTLSHPRGETTEKHRSSHFPPRD